MKKHAHVVVAPPNFVVLLTKFILLHGRLFPLYLPFLLVLLLSHDTNN
jgi:hypothetical protein